MHGKLDANDKVEFVWDGVSGDFLGQDVVNARKGLKISVSIHSITSLYGPCYHAGVDVIDGFCYSWIKKLTEEELDGVCNAYLVKEKINDPIKPDE